MRRDRIVPPETDVDITVPLGSGELRPGLINGHDHLYLNHYPRLGRPPYPDMYAWAADIQHRDADVIARAASLAREDALLFGALKNLLGGVTTVVHHDPWHGQLERDFPVNVVRVQVAHSLGLEANLPAIAQRAARERSLLSVHLAEGVTPAAADEIRTADRQGWLDQRLLAVHLVGVDSDGIRRLERAETAVIWCPSSNEFLYGCTAPTELFRARLDFLIGSDSLLTAAGTMFDELRAARRWGRLPDATLLNAIGPGAARRLELPPPTLQPGAPANLVVLRRPLWEARPVDVALAVVRGVPRLGDEDFAGLFQYLGVPTEPLTVGGQPRLVTEPLGGVAARVQELFAERTQLFA